MNFQLLDALQKRINNDKFSVRKMSNDSFAMIEVSLFYLRKEFNIDDNTMVEFCSL